MNPQEQCCHTRQCWADGRAGEGHIVIHRQRERRDKCDRCGRTFSATKGTAVYRAHQPVAAVVQVLPLLAHGCPPPAIVAACGWAERTVARDQAEAGAPCRRVHAHLVQAGRVDLRQVQAEEIRVRAVGGVFWVAMALTITSRLWLGGVVGAHRDRQLIRALLAQVRRCGLTEALLLCVAGLSSDVTHARRIFRVAVPPGKAGRPKLVLPAGVMLAPVVKQDAQRRVADVARRVVWGATDAVQARLAATHGAAMAVITTAYIERLNATFRARLAVLVHRSRAPARLVATVEAGMWLVGTCYNVCWPHDRLRRQRGAADPPGSKWVERTPAQAAGLTEHRWSVHELLTFAVPPPPRKRRGRRPRWLPEVAHAA